MIERLIQAQKHDPKGIRRLKLGCKYEGLKNLGREVVKYLNFFNYLYDFEIIFKYSVWGKNVF